MGNAFGCDRDVRISNGQRNGMFVVARGLSPDIKRYDDMSAVYAVPGRDNRNLFYGTLDQPLVVFRLQRIGNQARYPTIPFSIAVERTMDVDTNPKKIILSIGTSVRFRILPDSL